MNDEIEQTHNQYSTWTELWIEVIDAILYLNPVTLPSRFRRTPATPKPTTDNTVKKL